MNIFDIIFKQPIFNTLVGIYNAIPDLGISIIILTILIRLLLYPLSAKSLKSQRALQKHQPELAGLREKYKGRPKELNAAMMEFYRKNGINPASSCLPLIIQMPFLIALYFAFIDLIAHKYGLLYDFVPTPDHLNTTFMGVWDLSKRDATFILPLLAAGLQFWQTRMIMPKQIDPNDPAAAISRQLIYILPAVTFFFALTLPAALPLYWVATTIFSILQQRLVMSREVDVLEHAPVTAPAAAPREERKVVEGVVITRRSEPAKATSKPVAKRKKGKKK